MNDQNNPNTDADDDNDNDEKRMMTTIREAAIVASLVVW